MIFMVVRREGVSILGDICWSDGFEDPVTMHSGVPFEILNVFRCIPPGYTESGKPMAFACGYDEKIRVYGDEDVFSVDIGVGDILGFEFSRPA